VNISRVEAESTARRPTRAIIDLGAISHNIREIRKKIGTERDLMAVVKADGYGHGAVEVARAALESSADSLGVAIPEEGQDLRKAGIDVPILVLGLIQPGEAHKVVESSLDQTVCSVELAEALDQEARKASVRVNVHVKVDTGMNRIGLHPNDVPVFVRKIGQMRNLNVKGLFTHFPTADASDKSFARRQIDLFNRVIEEIHLMGIDIPQKHMANSAGVLDLPESYHDLVRPGIMIYGHYPSNEVSRSIRLCPAMTLKTRISFLKTVPPRTPIGYGGSFVTTRETRVATIPVGYGDGYPRLLSGQGVVSVNDRRAPLLGRVCMDMCMIDVSEVPHVKPGDEVILFGHDPTVEEIAAIVGTINYEILCLVGKRVPRIYVR
jgi:alanine racemase